MKNLLNKLLRIALFAGVFLLFAGGGTMTYFHYAAPAQSCLTCHEMQTSHDHWASSAHKNIHCRECHGGSLTLDFHAIKEHANRVVGHFKSAHDNIRLTHEQVLTVSKRCEACHATEASRWQAGHKASYTKIFLDQKQNKAEHLAADCLRCHGMLLDGPIESLVTPMDSKGPSWKLLQPELAGEPTMPCLVCHQVHAPRPQDASPSGLYVRKEKRHFPSHELPIAQMQVEGKAIKVSPDPRQRQCVQCHAPNSFHSVMTGDDYTATGKHEGLSCVACHDPHSGTTAASCAACHTTAAPKGYKVHVKPGK